MRSVRARLRHSISSWPVYDALKSCYHMAGLGDRGDALAMLKLWYSPFVSRGCLVFDIGANRGDHTSAFLSLGARVISVEPNSRCCAALRSRFFLRRARVEHCAIGSEPGQADLRIGDNDTLSSLSEDWMDRRTAKGRFGADHESRRETVRVRTFDELVAEHGNPDFVKIDVEGCEYEVFLGMSQRPAALCFEFNSEAIDIARSCVFRLADLGIDTFCLRMGRGDGDRPQDWMTRDQLLDALHRFETESCPIFGDVFAQ